MKEKFLSCTGDGLFVRPGPTYPLSQQPGFSPVCRQNIIQGAVRAIRIKPAIKGRLDKAVGDLEHAFEQNDSMLIAASIWPTLRPAQKDHRLRSILGRVGIDWVN